jgi:hypothetical protein
MCFQDVDYELRSQGMFMYIGFFGNFFTFRTTGMFALGWRRRLCFLASEKCRAASECLVVETICAERNFKKFSKIAILPALKPRIRIVITDHRVTHNANTIEEFEHFLPILALVRFIR